MLYGSLAKTEADLTYGREIRALTYLFVSSLASGGSCVRSNTLKHAGAFLRRERQPGRAQFSLLTCPHTTTFTLIRMFAPVEMSTVV